MSRVVLAAVCLIGLPLAARAALDPEVGEPYNLRVVLHVAEHRLLTPVFRKEIQRDLHDWLQGALGEMAQVEVIDTSEAEDMGKDPHLGELLKQVEAKGLQQFLDGWKDMSSFKTHFVLIGYNAGRYEIETGQHDGLTGLSSPVVRRDATFDRQFVARMAARAIDLDFGVIGTLDPDAHGPEVQVTLKGGSLAVPAERWPKAGDVFAIAQINQGASGTVSFQVPWALLQVVGEPQKGSCRCRLYTRFHEPLGKGLGNRCLKLGTTEAPLRFRLVDEKTFAPVSAWRIAVSQHSFEAKGEEYSTNLDGLIQTDDKKPLAHLAFVRVFNGEIPRAQVPVAIFANHTVVCPITRDAEGDVVADLDLRKRRWLEEIYDSLTVAGQLFKELSEMVKNKAHADALVRAQKGLADLKADIDARMADYASLSAAVKEAKAEARIDLGRGKQLLAQLQTRQTKLQDFIDNLNKVIKAENDPNRAKWLNQVTQAQLMETEADYARAIEIYEQVLRELPEGGDKPRLKEHLTELKAAWSVKSPEHAAARAFLYDTWPRLASIKDLQDNMARARAAFETCKKVEDRLSLRKLLLADVAHADLVKKKIEEIRSQDNEDARQEIKMITRVSTDLEQLHQDVSNYLQPAQPEAKATR